MASGGILVYGYDDRPATSPQPYAAEDIIIVSIRFLVSSMLLH